jgi:hypothetical protein
MDDGRNPDEQGRFRRGLRFRKRDDHAIELFREAQANLGDVARVKRIVVELGRYYNPYTNQAIVDPETRRRVIDFLEAGDAPAAGRLLDERLSLYTRAEIDEGGDGR